MLAVPIILILFSLVVYEYAYLGVKAEKASIRERRDTKMKTLNKYIAVIAERSSGCMTIPAPVSALKSALEKT